MEDRPLLKATRLTFENRRTKAEIVATIISYRPSRRKKIKRVPLRIMINIYALILALINKVMSIKALYSRS